MLLKFAPLKGSYVRRRQLEPLAISPELGKPTMPIRFDPRGIVRLNRVNELHGLGQCDADLLDTLLYLVAATNFVMRARLK